MTGMVESGRIKSSKLLPVRLSLRVLAHIVSSLVASLQERSSRVSSIGITSDRISSIQDLSCRVKYDLVGPVWIVSNQVVFRSQVTSGRFGSRQKLSYMISPDRPDL
jgi:hypothetical protein